MYYTLSVNLIRVFVFVTEGILHRNTEHCHSHREPFVQAHCLQTSMSTEPFSEALSALFSICLFHFLSGSFLCIRHRLQKRCSNKGSFTKRHDELMLFVKCKLEDGPHATKVLEAVMVLQFIYLFFFFSILVYWVQDIIVIS